ncbi:MAG: SDR family oxidoreductase [Marivita sp.]|uniref:SDR family NAD(P)-dependent oxidoreductase n=1 Tax=Marivita sp. TaxID=2003365 RepID=UPI003EF67F7A
MPRLQHKIALITGGAARIGFETARLFPDEGASVVLVDLDNETLGRAGTDLKGHALTIAADVSSSDDTQRYVRETVDRFGRIDVYFTNAGIEGKVAPLVDQTVADFDRVMAVNVRGAFLASDEAAFITGAQYPVDGGMAAG